MKKYEVKIITNILEMYTFPIIEASSASVAQHEAIIKFRYSNDDVITNIIVREV